MEMRVDIYENNLQTSNHISILSFMMQMAIKELGNFLLHITMKQKSS